MSQERVLLPVADNAAVRSFVWSTMRTRRLLLAVAVLALVGATLAALVFPRVVGEITDTVIAQESSAGRIDVLVLVLVVALAVQAVLTGLATALVARLGETALAGLREEVVERALSLPLADLERAGTGDLVARVGDDVDDVSEATRDAIPQLVLAALTIVLTVVGLGVLDWRLALAGFAAAPVQVLATRWYLRRSGPLYAAERIAIGARAQQLNESVTGAPTVRALRLSRRHAGLVETSSGRALDASVATMRTGSYFGASLNAAEMVGTVSVLVVGFLAVRAGAVTVGEATAAALYFHALFNPMMALLGLLDTAQDAAASLRRLVGVTAISPPPEPAHPTVPLDGSVALEGVRFAYVDDHDVLVGVDLRVAPGQRLALVGPSGAGKTTIAKLIAGISTASAGSVRLGGATHAELGAEHGRRAVTLVTQEVHVFAGSLADDLRLARPEATDDELHAALATVGADGWASLLPDGLATAVGEGGQPLTATQSQQLALARVALGDHRVVVLDEATAEAGSAGARELERSALAATRGRTTLVVAHRLTQAATADRIAVVDHGRVVEQGTHAELADGTGPYAALWGAWSTQRAPAR